jgi:hypothetical protein
MPDVMALFTLVGICVGWQQRLMAGSKQNGAVFEAKFMLLFSRRVSARLAVNHFQSARNPRLRRLNTKEARGLAAFHAACQH